MIRNSVVKKVLYSVVCLALLIQTACKKNSVSSINPENLVVSEGFKNPFGFYDAKPTFSWQLPISGSVKSQRAYRIVVASSTDLLDTNPDLWDSGKKMSNQSNWIQYEGLSLNSRQKVYWKVKFWNQNENASNWSKINYFELGLLDNKDWQAKWIGMDTKKEKVLGSKGNIIHRPQYLRKVFEVPNEVNSARLYITAKGVFDVAINEKDVSDDVMPPGFTPYKKRIETISYDVSGLVQSGSNTIGVELAEGWHSGRLGWNKGQWVDKESPKVLCQLELVLKDGSKQIIISDASWKGTTEGPIRRSEIYDGETYDAHFKIPEWTNTAFNHKSWKAVNEFSIEDAIQLSPKRHHSVRTKIKLNTQEIVEKDGAVIFDLKQNMVGVPLLKLPMKKGDTLRVRYAEMLSPDGSFYTKNYRSAQSTDYYIAAKDEVIEWMPKFTFHGFRYVELSGFDTTKIPKKDWVTGLVQYSDFEENGTFTTSNDKLNQLQSNIVWGLRSNFFDIPTDCPQRDERMGWTGDAQVFGPTSMFNTDVYSFWASWLQSIRESQFDNGGIPFVVPDILNNNKVSSGWGDVCVIIPWKIYYRTGDKRILKENFEMMKKWVQYHIESSKDNISQMNSFGDWLQPFPENGKNRGDTSTSLVGTAFFANAANLTAKAAKVLGKDDEFKTYTALNKNVAKAFEKQFFEKGKVKGVTETQTSYLLALAFDLISEQNKENAKKHLLDKIADAETHLRTGFLGTPLLSEVLDATGEFDIMYQLLFNETYPSWFYSINQGATTVWERWNSYTKEKGFNAQPMNSLNHYAYGAIGQWMYERIGGIAPLEAGYKTIRIAPIPKSPLTSASTTLNSPFGEVVASWQIKGDEFQLSIVVPPNTSAKVIIPGDTEKRILLNGVNLKNTEEVLLENKNKESFELLVFPGRYTFSSKLLSNQINTSNKNSD